MHINPPGVEASTGAVLSHISFMNAKITQITQVSFDRTDKNKVSFETENGLLLFLYSHNNNETMCFSKILQINEVLCRLGLCHPLFTDT